MGQPKTGNTNNLNSVTSTTGANVISSDLKTKERKIMHKTTGESPDTGFAKASPAFKDVKPDEKVVASEEAQRKAIEANIIKDEDESDNDDDNNDQG